MFGIFVRLVNLVKLNSRLLRDSECDLRHQLRKIATQQTLEYIQENMKQCICLDNADKKTLFDYILPKINSKGLILEFGVHKGSSITYISKNVDDRTVHGFDSFQGLPEDWHGNNRPKTYFSLKGKLPITPKNVELHKGWFNDTIPDFLKIHNQQISFIHIDCDLYSSTKIIFDLLSNQISKNCIIVFDEYFNYPNWKEHEFKAFQEFVKSNKISYRYIAFTNTQQVAVIIE